jgi:bifunctional DNA-binding transcriptional regulator/antitoxin component of YhaV-PrlF toxin-antitoxin module
MASTKVTKSTSEIDGRTTEQYRITIPKGLAEALHLEGARMEWEVDSANTLRLTRIDS